jgi:hypothetical protein
MYFGSAGAFHESSLDPDDSAWASALEQYQDAAGPAPARGRGVRGAGSRRGGRSPQSPSVLDLQAALRAELAPLMDRVAALEKGTPDRPPASRVPLLAAPFFGAPSGQPAGSAISNARSLLGQGAPDGFPIGGGRGRSAPPRAESLSPQVRSLITCQALLLSRADQLQHRAPRILRAYQGRVSVSSLLGSLRHWRRSREEAFPRWRKHAGWTQLQQDRGSTKPYGVQAARRQLPTNGESQGTQVSWLCSAFRAHVGCAQMW